MMIRPLHLDDARALLAFEQANRTWFERFVEPRPEATYSVSGIVAHITECLAASSRMVPFVICDADGRVLGRANLRHIDMETGAADIGYRIAEEAVGQGLATRAIVHLIARASEMGLAMLSAVVSVENHVSERLVERAGFVRDTFFPEHAALRHGHVDCWRYVRALEHPNVNDGISSHRGSYQGSSAPR